MDFRLTEEQQLLVDSLKEFCLREIPDNVIAELDEKHEFPWKQWQILADNGYTGLGIDEAYGGTPADVTTQCLVADVLGKYAFPLSVIYGLGVICIRDIQDFGTEEQKQTILGGVARGEPPIALGISEPQAASDASGLKTRADFDGDDVVINGQKIYCTIANVAKYILMMTRDPEIENPYKAMSMWIVPTDTPGVRINPLPKVGWWSVPTCEVFLENVRIPKSNLVGTLNNGWFQLMKNFEIERVALSASVVGAAEAAFEDAARYANSRVQFGKPIGTYQLIQKKIVDMAIKVENMRNYYSKVAWMMDNGIPVRHEHAMAKLYIAQTAFEVTDDAMQVFGGMGYMMAARVQRLWRDVRVMRIGGGTDEIMYNIAGPQLLKNFK